jgi:hypothetical protein
MEESVRIKIKDLQDQIDSVAQFRNPNTVEARLENINNQIEDLNRIMNTVSIKLQTLDFDKKFMEEFKDDEIKAFYQESGLKVQNIIEFLAKMKVSEYQSEDYAYRLVSGHVKDLTIRSIIGKFLRYHALKNKI